MKHRRNLKTSNRITIRRAQKEDTADIFALKRRAFGDAFLRYTIYQAPASVKHLEKIITIPTPNRYHVYVLVDGKTLAGYYQAVSIGETFFLSYIAVDSVYRGQCYGQCLLDHYEQLALDNRYEQLALDVFASNVYACEWYYANDYQPKTDRYLVLLPMTRKGAKNYHLISVVEDLERALVAESVDGFSKVEFRAEDTIVVVGLINGNTCKLLSYDGISLEDSVIFICEQFGMDRELLVVSDLSSIPSEWTPMHSDKVLRLVKPI